jgi:hypothetical protein
MDVQYSDYVSDVVYAYNQRTRQWTKVPVEYFYNSRVRGCQGDCEDLSLEFLIQAQEIKRLQTDDPLLRRLQQILRDGFYVVMLLAGISGAEINLQSASAELGAHMNAALVNKRKLHNWVRKSGGQLCKEHGPSLAELEAAKLYPPMVILEGTGPLNPNGIEESQGDAAGEALAAAAFRRYELVDKQIRPMFHYSGRGDESAFYKTVNVMLTDALMKEGCGQGIWALCQRGVSGTGANLTCSVQFRTIAAASDDIVALAQPELTPAQLSLIDHYMLDLHPTPSLEPPAALPEQAPAHVQQAREQMRWADEALAKLVDDAADQTPAKLVDRAVQDMIARRPDQALAREKMRWADQVLGRLVGGACADQTMAKLGCGARSGRELEVIRLIKYKHLAADRRFVEQFVSAVQDMIAGRADGRPHALCSYAVREEAVTRDRGGFYVTLKLAA